MEIILLHYRVIILAMAIINMVSAMLFLLWSDSLVRANEVLKKWITVYKINKALDSMRDIDERIMSMRKLVGTVAAVVALLLIFLYINF